MVENTRANIRKTRSMVKESIPGLMAVNTTANGKMEGNTVAESTYLSRANTEKVSGKMGREKSGSMKTETPRCDSPQS